LIEMRSNFGFLCDGRNDHRGFGPYGAYDEKRDSFFQNVGVCHHRPNAAAAVQRARRMSAAAHFVLLNWLVNKRTADAGLVSPCI
jgi:hypothetical protein